MKTSAFIAAFACAFSPAALLAKTERAGAPVMIEGLARQASLGFHASAEGGALIARRVVEGSPAAAAGLRDGDAIRRVNGVKFDRPFEGEALLKALDGGVSADLLVARDGKEELVAFTPQARPPEQIPGVRSIYGAAQTPDGARLRTIIAIPEGATAKLHPLLFTQWVSCGSVEYREGDESREILAALARSSGLALIRVERSSDGDSEGAACHALDYDTEVAHYVAAFKQAMTHPSIDASRVFINGSSLGSTTAPLVAHELQKGGYDIAGIAVQGGGAETYFERMLTFDRHYLERRPEEVAAADIHDEMLRRATFHHEYLIRGRSPDAIAKDGPAMAKTRAGIRGLGQGEHYGRPYAWHQQAAKRNFLAAWDALDADILVIFNEFDQFEARYGHKVIADMANRKRPGSATFVEQAGIDHSNERYRTIEDAYAWRDGAPAWEATAKILVDWHRARAGH